MMMVEGVVGRLEARVVIVRNEGTRVEWGDVEVARWVKTRRVTRSAN